MTRAKYRQVPIDCCVVCNRQLRLLTVPIKDGLINEALTLNLSSTSVLVYTVEDEICEVPRLSIAVITLVPPTTREPLTVTLPLCTVLAPLTRSGALISTSRVPVPFISLELRAPATNLLALSLMGCAVVVVRFRPSFCPKYICPTPKGRVEVYGRVAI